MVEKCLKKPVVASFSATAGFLQTERMDGMDDIERMKNMYGMEQYRNFI